MLLNMGVNDLVNVVEHVCECDWTWVLMLLNMGVHDLEIPMHYIYIYICVCFTYNDSIESFWNWFRLDTNRLDILWVVPDWFRIVWDCFRLVTSHFEIAINKLMCVCVLMYACMYVCMCVCLYVCCWTCVSLTLGMLLDMCVWMLLNMGMNGLGNLLRTMVALSRFGVGSDWIRIVLRLFEFHSFISLSIIT